MKHKIVFVVLLAIICVSCNNNKSTHTHQDQETTTGQCDHDHTAENAAHVDDEFAEGEEHDCDHDHESTDATQVDDKPVHEKTKIHNHEADIAQGSTEKAQADDGHNHEDVKIQLTAYSGNFEVFAEADPFVVGKVSYILAHFSTIPDFRAIEKGSITASLVVNGTEAHQKLNAPTRKGIFGFDIKPKTRGKGVLIFAIETNKGKFQLTVEDVEVFTDEHDAIHEAEEMAIQAGSATAFTKEQSWKIDFATELPLVEPFGQLIKTTARVLPAQNDEVLVSAKTNGMVMFTANDVLAGKSVASGQQLLNISASDLADNNLSVRYMEARNNYEKAKSDYDRKKELAKSKIVSEKELLDAKYNFDNARVIYDNLNENFSMSGQSVKSPVDGFINQLLVTNGQYVEVGQPLFSISQNKTLLLQAEVQQKYAPILGDIRSANIRTIFDKQTYTLEQLNGRVLSYGRTVNADNYLIPVTLQIENNGQFVSGGFVELYLKTLTNTRALTIPNSALLEEQGNFFVFVQITPELFEMYQVKPGPTDGLKTEITQGLSPDDRVVTKGAVLIKLARSSGALDAHSGHVH